MSIIGSNVLAGASGSGVEAYQIEQSLRFNQSYLLRTPSSAGNRRTYTFSVWLKRMNSGRDGFFGAWSATTSRDAFRFDSGTDELRIFLNETSNANIYSNAKYRDYSGWYHLVAAVDTTQATAADRVKVWINGESVSFRSASYPAQNSESYFNNTVKHYIGTTNLQNDQEWQGYLAEFHHVDGTALDHEDFGEFDANGVWRPIEVTGLTYGTNGFYLKFDPSATNGIGHDHSGNGNNFTPTGFTTSGTGTDVMSDTPTTNYATINPLETFNGRFSNAPTNGNLEISIPSDSTLKRNYAGKHASIVVPTTGKYYFEFETNQQYTRFVAVDVDYSTSVDSGDDYALTDKKSVIFSVSDGNYYYDGANNSTASGHGANSSPSGDIYGVAIDLGNGTLRVDLNGTAGTELDISDWAGGSARVAAFVSSSGSSATIKYNFGAQGFAQTPPTGFKALNTSNLPEPDIADGSQYFNTVLYTGDNTNQAITGVGFQPDWVWIKSRSSISDHVLQDAVRGAEKFLVSNRNDDEDTDSGTITSFDSDGFTIGSGNNKVAANNSGETFVAWNWLAGGSGSSNTDGSENATVSANPTAGFSIVTMTTNGTNETYGHGLGVAPKVVLAKSRNNAGNWLFMTNIIDGSMKYGILNSTASFTSLSFNAPTSTVFSYNQDDTWTNVAYCLAEVEGYSKFGTYTGNGTDEDGPFIYTGFAVSWLLVKKSSGTGDWYISDNKRNTYNAVTGRIDTNTSDAENTNNPWVDFLSNGFKIRDYDGSWNGSGSTFVYAAFAENPFGGSGVSPATAR